MYGNSPTRNKPYTARYTPYPPEKKDSSGCVQCASGLMVALNFIFFLFAAGIISVCIWILVERNFFSGVHGNVLMTVSAFLVLISACVLFFVAFLGCFGTLRKSYCMILTYVVILAGTAVVFLIGGVLAIVYRTQISVEVTVFMRESLRRDYGVNLDSKYNLMLTQSWDETQEKLCCCAVEDQSWNVYRESEWYKIQPGIEFAEKPFVPVSCCVRDDDKMYVSQQKCQTWELGPPGITNGDLNEAVYYRGCYEAGKHFVHNYTAILMGFGIGMALLLSLGIACGIVLLISYRKQ